MLVGEGDLPRSGASRCIQGRAYADLEWILAAIVRGKCSAPVERHRANNQLVACGLPASMIQIKIASWSGAPSQRISRRPDQPRWQHGMRGRHGVRHILVGSVGLARSQSAQSTSDFWARLAGGRCIEGRSVRRDRIFVFRNMTCSPGLADDSSVRTQWHQALHVRMPKVEMGERPICGSRMH
jgi:hypothetical protein